MRGLCARARVDVDVCMYLYVCVFVYMYMYVCVYVRLFSFIQRRQVAATLSALTHVQIIENTEHMHATHI